VSALGEHADSLRAVVISPASKEDVPTGTASADSIGCQQDNLIAQQRCLRARLDALDASLEKIRLNGQAEDERSADLYLASLVHSSMLSERWKLLWDDRRSNVVLALLVALVMVLGDLLRDFSVGALRRYEQSRATGARKAVESGYERARQSVADALAPYAADPLPGLRWHERSRYFETPSAAWLSLGGVVASAGGSDVELRQVLAPPGGTSLLPAPQQDAIPDPTGPAT
jgi:hypothetical protein